MKTNQGAAAGIVSQAAYRDKLQDDFRELYLPAGTAIWKALASWTQLSERSGHDKAVLASMDGVRLKVLGQATGNRDMAVKSLQMTGIVLRELRQQISRMSTIEDKKRAFRLCFMLTVANVCMMGTAHRLSKDGQGQKEWQDHLPGVEMTLQALGPEAFAVDDLHCVFSLTRILMLGQSIHDERRTFMSTPDWKTLPYKGQLKHPIQNLFDILFDASDLVCETQEMAAAASSSKDDYPAMLDDFASRHAQILIDRDAWRKRFSGILGLDAIFSCDLTRVGSESSFSSMVEGIHVLFYHLVTLCFYDAAYRVSRCAGKLPIPAQHRAYFAQLDDDLSDATRAVESIISCLSYCGQLDLGIALKTFTGLPLIVAQRFLHRHSLSIPLWKLQRVVQQYIDNDLILLADFADPAVTPPSGSLGGSTAFASAGRYRDYMPPVLGQQTIR